RKGRLGPVFVCRRAGSSDPLAGGTMALYMLQASYTSEAWAAMAQQPADREQVFRNLVEGLGGRLLGFYFCLGDYDVVATYEAGDAANATGIAIAAYAAGALRAVKRPPLTTDA